MDCNQDKHAAAVYLILICINQFFSLINTFMSFSANPIFSNGEPEVGVYEMKRNAFETKYLMKALG